VAQGDTASLEWLKISCSTSTARPMQRTGCDLPRDPTSRKTPRCPERCASGFGFRIPHCAHPPAPPCTVDHRGQEFTSAIRCPARTFVDLCYPCTRCTDCLRRTRAKCWPHPVRSSSYWSVLSRSVHGVWRLAIIRSTSTSVRSLYFLSAQSRAVRLNAPACSLSQDPTSPVLVRSHCMGREPASAASPPSCVKRTNAGRP
jgi:hypothetical protein